MSPTLLVNPYWAALFWPFIGLGMGLFLALVSRNRSLVTGASYLLVGACGTSAGGLLTLLFTYRRPALGGFFTSMVTCMLGGLVFLGLWKAVLEALDRRRAEPR